MTEIDSSPTTEINNELEVVEIGSESVDGLNSFARIMRAQLTVASFDTEGVTNPGAKAFLAKVPQILKESQEAGGRTTDFFRVTAENLANGNPVEITRNNLTGESGTHSYTVVVIAGEPEKPERTVQILGQREFDFLLTGLFPPKDAKSKVATLGDAMGLNETRKSEITEALRKRKIVQLKPPPKPVVK